MINTDRWITITYPQTRDGCEFLEHFSFLFLTNLVAIHDNPWEGVKLRSMAQSRGNTMIDFVVGWLVSLFVCFFFGRKYPISRMRISLTGTRHSSARPEGDRASEFRCRTKLSVTGPDGTSSVWASVCACVCVCSSRSRFIFRNSRSVCIEGDTIGTWVWARAGLFGKPVWFHSKTDQMYGQCQAKSPWVGPSILCRNGDTRGLSHKTPGTNRDVFDFPLLFCPVFFSFESWTNDNKRRWGFGDGWLKDGPPPKTHQQKWRNPGRIWIVNRDTTRRESRLSPSLIC